MVVLPTAVLMLWFPDWPRWSFMWALAVAIFLGCKWLTWRPTSALEIPWWHHAGYLLAWPGLDAKAFLRPREISNRNRPAKREWTFAGLKLVIGVALFWGGSRLVPQEREMLLGWVGMVGLIFMLHFGAFHLLSCFWRTIGVDARPLMNQPLASVSVSEFWGKRWNTAFRDLTHRFLFRPLTARWGPHWAIFASFAFSGLVHDLVISLPARGGYGWPTLFFVVQALALLVERSRAGQAIGLGRGWRGWLFTTVVLVVPAYGLFHPPFVLEIIVPFMRALNAA